MRFPGQDPEPITEYLSPDDFQALHLIWRNALDASDGEFES